MWKSWLAGFKVTGKVPGEGAAASPRESDSGKLQNAILSTGLPDRAEAGCREWWEGCPRTPGVHASPLT